MYAIEKINNQRQITLPESVYNELGISENDYVVFFKNERNQIVISRLDSQAANDEFLMIDHPPEYKVNRKRRTEEC